MNPNEITSIIRDWRTTPQLDRVPELLDMLPPG